MLQRGSGPVCEMCKEAITSKYGQGYVAKRRFCSCDCKNKAQTKTIEERFWARVIINPNPESCWSWTGATTYGYGILGLCRRKEGIGTTLRASRVSWELHFGKIPEGMFVCHKCDNPPCCNPKHLFIGSAEDNARDSISKGRDYNIIQRTPSSIEDQIKAAYIKDNAWGCLSRLSRMFHVSDATVRRIVLLNA